MVALLFLPTFVLLLFTPTTFSQLTTHHYQKTCPKFDQIMQETTTNKQINSPTTAATTLCLLFHDAFVYGLDASVLISSTPFHKAERDSGIKFSLPGDAFDLVVRAKTALELSCPAAVSYSDILAPAARNLVSMSAGPYYPLRFGRKDSLTSSAVAVAVAGNLSLPPPTATCHATIGAAITGTFLAITEN